MHGEYKNCLFKCLKNSVHFLFSGKLLVELPAFDWLRTTVSKIRFPYEMQMSHKTTRFLLPIQHENENKLEECCDIMDVYEEYLNGAF